MKKLIFALILTVSFSSCINLKSPYPAISYYRLASEPFNVKSIDTIKTTVQLRNLTINDEFNTDHIIATKLPGKEVQVYYYHRWISKFDDLVTGYMLSRLNGYGVFDGGVVGASSINLPNYVIEGRILNVNINNSDKIGTDVNWAEVTLNISFYSRSKEKPGLELLFNKNYTQRINRQNNLAKSIEPSMSKVIAFLSDMILVDVHNAIKANM